MLCSKRNCQREAALGNSYYWIIDILCQELVLGNRICTKWVCSALSYWTRTMHVTQTGLLVFFLRMWFETQMMDYYKLFA